MEELDNCSVCSKSIESVPTVFRSFSLSESVCIDCEEKFDHRGRRCFEYADPIIDNLGVTVIIRDGEDIKLIIKTQTCSEKCYKAVKSSVKKESKKAVLRVVNSCANCGTCGKFKACGQCRDVHYCSKFCQRSHWFSHKLECKK